MICAYMIYTQLKNDPGPVRDALGADFYNGKFEKANHPSNKIWRFETEEPLGEATKARLKHPYPGMAGFTEVSDATPTLSRDRWDF